MTDPFDQLYRETMFSGGASEIVDLDTLWGTFPKECPDSDFLELTEQPKLDFVERDILRVLRNRRSRRNYSSRPLEADLVAGLLLYAVGVGGYAESYGFRRFPLRMFPSAGGLQATETYVSVDSEAITGVPSGVYHYNAVRHGLERVGGVGAERHVLEALKLAQVWLGANAPPVVLVLTIAYERLKRKYGRRAARLAAADPGFVGENIYLVGEALGLAVTAFAGFDERIMAETLSVELDGGEYPFLAFGIGHRMEES